MALLQFDGGTMVSVETSWFVPERAPANVLAEGWFGTIDAELEIVGTEQSARLRILESGLEIWTSQVTKHPEPGLWPVVHGGVGGALREEVSHFIDNVRSGRCLMSHRRLMRSLGLEIAEAIIASAEQGVEDRSAGGTSTMRVVHLVRRGTRSCELKRQIERALSQSMEDNRGDRSVKRYRDETDAGDARAMAAAPVGDEQRPRRPDRQCVQEMSRS